MVRGKILKAMTKGAASLGAALAKSQLRKRKPPPRGRAVKPRKVGILQTAKVSSKVASAPAALSYVTNRGVNRSTHFETIDSSNIALNADAHGNLYFSSLSPAAGSTAVASPAQYNMNLTPYQNSIPDQAGMFGSSLYQLATAYTKYRLHWMTATFESSQPTSTAGIFGMAISPDPASLIGGWTTLESLQGGGAGNFYGSNVPIMCGFDFNRHHAAKGEGNPWNFVAKSAIASGPEARQDYPGNLCVYARSKPVNTIGGLTNGTLGVIHIRGLVEFDEISTLSNPAGFASKSLSVLSDSNPAPAAAELTASTADFTVTLANPFGSASPNSLIYTSTTPQVDIPNTTDIRFGFAAAADGIWQIRGTGQDISGVITIGYDASDADSGNTVSALMSYTASSAPPYSWQIIYAVSGSKGDGVNYSTLSISGPTTATSGNSQLDVLRVA